MKLTFFLKWDWAHQTRESVEPSFFLQEQKEELRLRNYSEIYLWNIHVACKLVTSVFSVCDFKLDLKA